MRMFGVGVTSHNLMQVAMVLACAAVAELLIAASIFWLYVNKGWMDVGIIAFFELILPALAVAIATVMLPATVLGALVTFAAALCCNVITIAGPLCKRFRI